MLKRVKVAAEQTRPHISRPSLVCVGGYLEIGMALTSSSAFRTSVASRRRNRIPIKREPARVNVPHPAGVPEGWGTGRTFYGLSF